jgi:small-conductance mechanosensitive channel
MIGDFIIVDDCLGTVEHIGLKTTNVRSLSGEQLVFSNNDLLRSRIRNYKRMAERRVAFTLGVTYQTPSDKLRPSPTSFATS